MPKPSVRKTAWSNAPRVQMDRAKRGSGSFSHDDYLPLRVSVRRKGWLSRKVQVVTIEKTSYQNAILDIAIPPEFTSDLASIPRLLFGLVSPWDIALEALFHDQLYREQEVTRAVADFVLRMMMAERGVPWHIRWTVYLAVRMFGGSAWEQHRAANAERARRVFEARGGTAECD